MTRRTERVAEAIKRLVSEIIHGQLRDPRTAGFITITKVEVTADLRLAKVYYSVLGDEKKKKLIARGLSSAKSFMRKHIADRLGMRYATNITFRLDESGEHRECIDEILNKLEKERKNEGSKKDSRSDQ